MIAFRRPDTARQFDLPSDKFILGTPGSPSPAVGFGQAVKKARKGELVTYSGKAHLASIAPTRSGKGIGVVVPNLLAYGGPVVVFDPKGEAFLTTARRRRQFGPVYKFDPFGVIEEESDSFNPLDIFTLAGRDAESDLQTIAELFARGQTSAKEPFWDAWGGAVVFGALAVALTHDDPAKRNVPHALELLMGDDVVYNMAVILDTVGKRLPPAAYREIAAVLQQPDVTRGGVLATSQSYMKAFNCERVARTMRSTSFSLADFVAGDPMTLYLVLPPERIPMYRSLLKIWIGTLMMAIFSRKHHPSQSTLFMLDEAASLQNFPLLETMLTLGAGYGCTCWTIWQNLAQMQSCYPASWKTILDNCGVLQAFGFYNRSMATQWADYFDHSTQQIRAMAAEEQILSIHGQGELRCRRLSYLQHEAFAGLFDDNRFYHKPPKINRFDDGKPERS